MNDYFRLPVPPEATVTGTVPEQDKIVLAVSVDHVQGAPVHVAHPFLRPQVHQLQSLDRLPGDQESGTRQPMGFGAAVWTGEGLQYALRAVHFSC